MYVSQPIYTINIGLFSQDYEEVLQDCFGILFWVYRCPILQVATLPWPRPPQTPNHRAPWKSFENSFSRLRQKEVERHKVGKCCIPSVISDENILFFPVGILKINVYKKMFKMQLFFVCRYFWSLRKASLKPLE